MFILRSSPRILADRAGRFGSLPGIGKRFAPAAIVLLAGVYIAAPYVTLWRLTEALQHGDDKALEASVDWDAVREGLKEDVADGIVGKGESENIAAPTEAQSDELPPFGASFVKGIAGGVINRDVKPEQLCAVFQQAQGSGTNLASFLFNDVEYAFFDGLDTFHVRVLRPGEESEDAPIQIEMALQHYAWKVVRVRMSPAFSGSTPKRI